MSHNVLGSDEISRIGENLYASAIRAQVENEENVGKMVIIDVDSGDYEVDQSGAKAAGQMYAKRPDAVLYGIRIGYRAADAIGGAMERVTG